MYVSFDFFNFTIIWICVSVSCLNFNFVRSFNVDVIIEEGSFDDSIYLKVPLKDFIYDALSVWFMCL